MNTKPLNFNDSMVRALSDGRKVQDRRVMKPRKGKDRLVCPYGQAGDFVWVRQTWGYYQQFFSPTAEMVGPVVYRVDGGPAGMHGDHWRPPLHMPRWASRLTLRLTEVRAQRVQEISEFDVWLEGIDVPRCESCGCSQAEARYFFDHRFCDKQEIDSAIPAFAHIWDFANAKRGDGWDMNPWVWVLSFEVLHANIDSFAQKEAA